MRTCAGLTALTIAFLVGACQVLAPSAGLAPGADPVQPAATPAAVEICALNVVGSTVQIEISGPGALAMCEQWQYTRRGFAAASLDPRARELCALPFGELSYTVRDPAGASAAAEYFCGNFRSRSWR